MLFFHLAIFIEIKLIATTCYFILIAICKYIGTWKNPPGFIIMKGFHPTITLYGSLIREISICAGWVSTRHVPVESTGGNVPWMKNFACFPLQWSIYITKDSHDKIRFVTPPKWFYRQVLPPHGNSFSYVRGFKLVVGRVRIHAELKKTNFCSIHNLLYNSLEKSWISNVMEAEIL